MTGRFGSGGVGDESAAVAVVVAVVVGEVGDAVASSPRDVADALAPGGGAEVTLPGVAHAAIDKIARWCGRITPVRAAWVAHSAEAKSPRGRARHSACTCPSGPLPSEGREATLRRRDFAALPYEDGRLEPLLGS